MKEKHKILETHLVITTGLLVVYFLRGKNEVLLLYLALGVGLTGIFIKPLAQLITKGWFGLAHILNKVSSTVIMALVYYLILLPIATFYKLSNKRLLDLRDPGDSLWHVRDHQYTKEDLENVW